MKKCKILIGIPCSSKSTWARKQGIPILSCDEIRKELSNGYYNYGNKEKLVWETFYHRLSQVNTDIIIDNTNCRLVYINKIKEILGSSWEFEYIWFDIPLWKAIYRNYRRWFLEDKYVPIKVLRNMKSNYEKLKNDKHLFM